MEQNEKSLEEMFAEVTASPEGLEQVNGGASAARVLLADRRAAPRTEVLSAVGGLRLDERLLADLSGYFNRGLGALEGGMAFRPDRDVGH